MLFWSLLPVCTFVYKVKGKKEEMMLVSSEFGSNMIVVVTMMLTIIKQLAPQLLLWEKKISLFKKIDSASFCKKRRIQ